MRRIALPAVLVVFGFVAHVPAQQSTFKTNVELVRVDAVVVDKDGKAVHGLTQNDFALTDRKQPQSIATFEEISHPRRMSGALSPASAFPVTFKMDVATNTTVQADRLVMLVIDDLHIWQGRTEKAKELAREVVTKLGAQASMAVIFSSREGSTEVTQDRSQLMRAIDGMKARQSFRRPAEFVSPRTAFVDQSDPEFMAKKFDAVSAGQRKSLLEYGGNMQFFQILQDMGDLLHNEDQRRKAFVWISEGIGTDFSRVAGSLSDVVDVGPGTVAGDLQTNTVMADTTRGAMDALRKANVALYAIDPRGKVRAEDMMLESWPPKDCAVCNSPPGLPAPGERVPSREDSQFAWENPVRLAQDGLGFLSAAAGGFAVTDTDDLTGGLDRIIDDLDHYYLVGFYPTDAGRSSHPVGLTVPGHPDYTIRFRRGYTPGPAPPARPKNKDPLVELASGVLPRNDLPLRLTAVPLVGLGKKASVVLALEVTAPVGLMKEIDAKLRDDVTYQLMVVDENKSKVAQREGRAAKFSMSGRGTGDEPAMVTYQIPVTLDLNPGRYQIRASAMSKKLDKGGSVYLDVTVPDFSKAALAVSGISLGFVGGPRVPVGRTNVRTVMTGSRPGMNAAVDPSTLPPAQQRALNDKNPLPFEPTLSREFDQTDSLRAYFEVTRQDERSTVALSITVIGANNAPLLAIDKTVGPNDSGKVTLPLTLSTLGPGAFRLRVTATDSHNVAKSETGIIVK